MKQTKLRPLVLHFLTFLNCLLVLSGLVSLGSLPTYARSCCRRVERGKEKKKKMYVW